MNEILVKQLAIDFCTDAESVKSKENVFTEYKALEGRRIFLEGECFLKIAAVNGKILASGKADIINRIRDKYKNAVGAWFMDMACLHELEDELKQFGCRVAQAHPFYIAENKSEIDIVDYEIKIFVGDELEQFRGDERFGEAFIFSDVPKDEIGVAAFKNGEIIGMAGATSDSELMWQIGINVLPAGEGLGVAKTLVSVLKNEILDRGKLPFYGTSMSHIISQRVALGAGFLPAWSELYCEEYKVMP